MGWAVTNIISFPRGSAAAAITQNFFCVIAVLSYNQGVSQPTRTILLACLKETQPASAAELAARLGMSAAGVRYQLALMAAEGLLEEAPQDPDRPAPGRPARRYHLTRRVAPDNLAALCTALLEIIPNGPDAAVWEQLARRLGSSPPQRASMPRRLEHAVAELTPLHYQPSWEAGPRGPLIRLRACPYAAIWAKVPFICSLDAALLSRLTAAEVHQTARTAFGGAGPSACVFEIRP